MTNPGGPTSQVGTLPLFVVKIDPSPTFTNVDDIISRDLFCYILGFTYLSIEKEFSVSTLWIRFFAYFLVMDAFAQLEVEGASSDEIKPRVPNIAVEIARGCRLTFDWDETLLLQLTTRHSTKPRDANTATHALVLSQSFQSFSFYTLPGSFHLSLL